MSRKRRRSLLVVERFSTPAENRVRVRVATSNVIESFEREINRVLEEEYANGPEIVDIKFASTPPHANSALGEYVALILLRGGRPSQ
jgi:hypothetical protein